MRKIPIHLTTKPSLNYEKGFSENVRSSVNNRIVK